MKNLLVSFSGGETSAYMAQWLWKNKREEYNMVFVFANTGFENIETHQFVYRVSEHFGFKVYCIEADVKFDQRKSTGYKIVNFWDLNYEGKPFEDMIKKYGIPNMAFKHCSRELKLNPITHFAKDYFNGEEYYSAIGIREDEIDRMSVKRVEKKLIYPLISMRPMTKKKVNFFWKMQTFRLDLKGYEGNCIFCWKKSEKKLIKLAKERPRDLMDIYVLEAKYGFHYPNKEVLKDEYGIRDLPIRFFRGQLSTFDLADLAKTTDPEVLNDADVYDESESCDIYAECGIDN